MLTQEKFSILLVDDDISAVRILKSILADYAPLRYATSGRAALRLARESVPDLVLLDVELPEFSGFDVCKAFKSDPLLARVPIIFISSHESSELEEKALALGAVDFICKPPHAPLLLARVRTYQRLQVLSDTMSTTLRNAVAMDFLTGAVTRRRLEKAVAHEWQRAMRSAAPLALLLVDIEGFSAYNDEFGEEQGDACLKSVADVLRSVAQRPTDVLGRWAGGRFAVLLPETDIQGAAVVAQRSIDAVEALRIPRTGAPDRSIHVALSVGGGCRGPIKSATRLDGGVAIPNPLIAAAELALSSPKPSGANQPRLIDVADVDGAEPMRSIH
jgi:diguanylate cyclase (GGDEF)-like protein